MTSTILVADDDRGIRTVLTQALGRAGYDVRTTSNASTLWRWVADGEGDLVITDVVMPDENGLDLLPRIKKSARTCAKTGPTIGRSAIASMVKSPARKPSSIS